MSAQDDGAFSLVLYCMIDDWTWSSGQSELKALTRDCASATLNPLRVVLSHTSNSTSTITLPLRQDRDVTLTMNCHCGTSTVLYTLGPPAPEESPRSSRHLLLHNKEHVNNLNQELHLWNLLGLPHSLLCGYMKLRPWAPVVEQQRA